MGGMSSVFSAGNSFAALRSSRILIAVGLRIPGLSQYANVCSTHQIIVFQSSTFKGK
jgi:hypothetical protein